MLGRTAAITGAADTNLVLKKLPELAESSGRTVTMDKRWGVFVLDRLCSRII